MDRKSVMKPNTAHMVFTPKPTICHGGHAFLTGLMQDTLRGMIHGLVDHYQITNTNHPPAGMLLRRIASFYHAAFIFEAGDLMEGTDVFDILFYHLTLFSDDEREHLPDVATVEGFVDFFALCFLVIFGNVLDFRTYVCSNENKRYSHLKAQHDLNNIDVQERVNMCSARGMCFDLLDWWKATFIIKAVENQEELPSFTEDFISKEANNLVCYKSRASISKRKGAEGCTIKELTSQVLNVIKIVSWRGGWERAWTRISCVADRDASAAVMGFETHEFTKWVIEKREFSLTFGASRKSLLVSPPEQLAPQNHQGTSLPGGARPTIEVSLNAPPDPLLLPTTNGQDYTSSIYMYVSNKEQSCVEHRDEQ